MRRIALAVILILSGAVPIARSATAGVSGMRTPGSRLWVARFDARAAGIDRATSVATSPDGRVAFVLGESYEGTAVDYVTIACRTSGGQELWRTRRTGPPSYLATGSLTVSPDGALVFVSASVSRRSGSRVMATIAYQASTGAVVWERRTSARPGGLAISPDGTRVFVTGWDADGSGSTYYATVAYDAATGTELWEKIYGGDGTGRSGGLASAIAVSPDGARVFVSGSGGGRRDDTVTLSYDASTGSRTWLARLRVVDGQDVVAIAVSPDGGRVFVAGNTIRELAHLGSSTTVAYDSSTGQEIWQTRSDSSRTPSYVTSMVVSPDSGILYIAGRRVGGDCFEWVTTAYDAASGSKLWGRRYSGEIGWSTVANGVVASPDGSGGARHRHDSGRHEGGRHRRERRLDEYRLHDGRIRSVTRSPPLWAHDRGAVPSAEGALGVTSVVQLTGNDHHHFDVIPRPRHDTRSPALRFVPTVRDIRRESIANAWTRLSAVGRIGCASSVRFAHH